LRADRHVLESGSIPVLAVSADGRTADVRRLTPDALDEYCKGPEEAPFASALLNFARALGDAGSTWFLELVTRWRGDLHSDRLVDQVGQNWFRTIEAHSLLPRDPAPLLPDGQPSATGSLQQFAHMIEGQVSVMTTADIFLLMAALCGVYVLVTLVLPVRTYPPRILLAGR